MSKRILYFLEDRAHETFITSLVRQVAEEEGVQVEDEIINARGGAPTALTELQTFCRGLYESTNPRHRHDILVVGIDANCHGHHGKVQEIRHAIGDPGIRGHAVYCVPDPHIERWYLADQKALTEALGEHANIRAMPYNCEKGYYKERLADIAQYSKSLLGGPEYGEDIAIRLRYDVVANEDPSFKQFLQELRNQIRR